MGKNSDPSAKKKSKSGLQKLVKKGKQGRPTKWTQNIEDHVVKQLALGVPLRAICREEGMPTFFAIYDWMERDSGFEQRIARAREVGWESIAQECLEIAHDERHDYALTKRGIVFQESHVQRAKLQIETRLKLLAKWMPKKYGDKIELGGAVGFVSLPELLDKAREIRMLDDGDVVEGEAALLTQ